MPPPLLLLQDIHLTLGGAPLLDGAELSLSAGERLCLVGRNGSGKSTLLRIAAGELTADSGTRFLQPGVTVRTLPQEPDLFGFANVLAYVEAGLGPSDDPHRARLLLETLGLTGDEDPARLSGGETRRAALARVLAPRPDILLLDEPTNHLDLPAIEWLESELAALRSALVIVSHDRRFLQNLSRATVWLDRGRTRRLERGFGDFETWRDTLLEEEERDRHKLDRQIAEEEHWLRYGVTARRKRNVGRLAKLAALRKDYREARRPLGNVRFDVSEARLSGRLVIEAEHIAKSYGERRIVDDFSIRVLRGDRLALVGANGAGKTTLLELLTGRRAPDSGTVRLGANIAMASLDQARTALDPQATLAEVLTGGAGDTVEINGERRHVVGYMKDFLFTPDQARTPVTRLSGGERGRLMLARALALPSNLLVLDEPTNDLDLETLDLLQEMVADYPGTVLLVSHDRDFLDRVATSVVVAEGNGKWIEYAGGYSDMVAQRGFGIGALAPPKPTVTAKEPRPPSPAAAPARKERLSFKQKHALATLPGRIDELRNRKEELRRTLDDASLYARDPEEFRAISQAFTTVEADLAAAEEQWLELEILRESLEG